MLLSACAAPEPRIPPPDPILETDVVKDAEAAARIANTCSFITGKKGWQRFMANEARLIGDDWSFVAGGGISMLEVKVSKRTGLLTDCTDIEQ
jgi:hypothetical protein